jgi:hypothetical protein
MKKWKAIVSVILVFFLGALSGAIVAHEIDQRRIAGIIRGEPGAVGELIVQRLNHKLNLDAAQLEKLRGIVNETGEEIRNVRKQVRPQIEEILERSQNRVRAILRPDQLEKYERIVAERKMRRGRKGSSR